jgi:prenyltransferase beta subunit
MRRFATVLALGTLLLVASAAAAPNPATQAALDRTVRYLQEAQQPSGGFAASGEPSQITSAWTALALAAAGINPRDQARPGGGDAFAYLEANYREGIDESECAPIACTTTLERELMVINTAGANPHDFSGADLVAELLGRALPNGSFPHVPGGLAGVNDTIFAIFALALVGEPAAQAAIQPAADWVEAIQHEDGGWAWSATSTQSEVDMTGAAIQALIAAGRGGNAAVEAGVAYLRKAQNPDGGFAEFPGNPESNVASTAWAVQAIWAAGENPEAWRSGSGLETEEPLDYMESLQEPDGHIRWKRSRDLNGIWMTAYSSVALGGHDWPIPPVPRAIPPSQPVEPGEGGRQSRSGVIAGGGGRGAPLFSRPRPQSRGRTPGGARVLEGKENPANHSETRRGENAEQPEQTQRAEASAPPADPEATARSAAFEDGDGKGGGASTEASGASPGGDPKGQGSGPSATGEVTGLLVASADSARGGELAFGAPGLHGAGPQDDAGSLAIGIAAAALLLGLAGARWERRRQEAVA